MNELQNFNFSGQDVRIITINDEPWFIDKDVTTFNPIQALEYHKKCGEKSLNCAKLDEDYGMNNCTISGKKEKVFFDYNMNSLFDYIEAMEAYEDNIPEPVDYE